MRARAGRGLTWVAALVAALALVACGGGGDGGGDDAATTPATTAESPPPRTDAERGDELARTDGDPRLETVARDLDVPWELAFLPDGRALVTERGGRVRLLGRDGELREDAVAEVEVQPAGEGGLLGLAIDPDFEDNGYVYLYRTRAGGNEVVRYRFADGGLGSGRVLVDGIPAAPIHDGGRLRFGPDGRLYVTTGDAARPELAQDPDSLAGKILTLDRDALHGGGGRPEVHSLGHRNSQGLDWRPDTERLYASEHGPVGDDEVNLIREGGNYGWPVVQGDETRDRFVAPIRVYEDSIAPSGATFVHLPGSAWSGDFLIGCLVGEQIRRLRFDGREVTLDEALFEDELGRVRTVVEGPDGALYALTNNRDGRGTPRAADDRVVRIVPPAS